MTAQALSRSSFYAARSPPAYLLTATRLGILSAYSGPPPRLEAFPPQILWLPQPIVPAQPYCYAMNRSTSPRRSCHYRCAVIYDIRIKTENLAIQP